MFNVSVDEASSVLIVRLNNFRSIQAAYGEEVALGAVEHLRARIVPRFATMAVIQNVPDEIELVLADVLPHPFSRSIVVDTLCASLAVEPYRHAGDAVLLTLAAGCASLQDFPNDELRFDRARIDARNMMDNASCTPDSFADWGAAWAVLYRADMAAGIALLEQLARGEAFLAWQAVRKVSDPSRILHHEAHLCRIGHDGQRIGCEEAYRGLERLELAHLVDQQLVSRALDELKADPKARINVPISAQSLSFHLHGKDAGWTELRRQLRNNPSLANRLVIEVAESAPLLSLGHAKEFVDGVRRSGAHFALSQFGSARVSMGQLFFLAPDLIKLDGDFLRTAFQSYQHRTRIARLVELAHSVASIVIVDGAESHEHFDLAREQGAEWIVGHHMGQLSMSRAVAAEPRLRQETAEKVVVFEARAA
ncbi:MAG: EAL domain-containing protein [Sphingobium sp.]|nr:EAL domain-containing protein [Sphingobium sp.]